jgi:hypothetical protein
MNSLFTQLLQPIDVVAEMNRLGNLEITLKETGSIMKAIAATNKSGYTSGAIEPKLDDIDEEGNHLTLIDTFLNEFNVSQEDRTELDEGYPITLQMTGMEYIQWILVRHGCIQYQQQELTTEYIDWCLANGYAD